MPAAEAVLAATAAWLIAANLIGHPAPVFAPSAALVALAESRGRRLRQSIEIVLGVAAGVLVADLAMQVLGPGAVTIAVVLLLTVGPMIAFGASTTLIVQAAISAIYLIAVAEPRTDVMQWRCVDALVGGALALTVSQLAVARNPLAPLVGEARRTFTDLAALIDTVDQALRDRDHTAADDALRRARQAHARVERLQAAVLATGETLKLRVRRRRNLNQVRQVQATAVELDRVVDNIWVLARNAVTLTRLDVPTPPELSHALTALGDAIRAAGESLATDLTGTEDPQQHAGRADHTALEAVRIAAKLLEAQPALPLTMIIGQIRATAIDLLRGVGHDDDILSRVDEAVGLTTPQLGQPGPGWNAAASNSHRPPPPRAAEGEASA
ncbi:FUSC family protein [Actinoplanes siamensis]|uniref:FUSC family protein n=1 Tax=Actinoplanes siamensis TaxID=1223317 RepID=A0A919N5P5_9ACTN|nr:FUSC family protein [Actinoplanes siamensis]GIF04845.1 FUSC family protein [Actinoplanes siamensis]